MWEICFNKADQGANNHKKNGLWAAHVEMIDPLLDVIPSFCGRKTGTCFQLQSFPHRSTSVQQTHDLSLNAQSFLHVSQPCMMPTLTAGPGLSVQECNLNSHL